MTRDPSDGSVNGPPEIESASPIPSSYTALKARHGETWGINQPAPLPKTPFKSMSAQQLAEHYAKHDLGFKAKPEEI